ncbi:MAG: DUF2089 domain-containing protein [bacterium]|nr:DUF2089 domain-containing protein [bacterium]
MADEQKRILEMIEKGTVSKEEGLKLLKALENSPKISSQSQLETVYPNRGSRLFKAIYNPFVLLTGPQTIAAGAVTLLLLFLAGWLCGTRFDGALDLHPSTRLLETGQPDPYWLILLEIFTGWLCVAFSFFFIATILSKSKQRLLSYLAYSAIARFPYILAACLGGSRFGLGKLLKGLESSKGHELSLRLQQEPLILVGILVLMVFLVWFMVLHFFALKEASGLNTKKTWPVFIGGLLVAEIAGKIILMVLL